MYGTILDYRIKGLIQKSMVEYNALIFLRLFNHFGPNFLKQIKKKASVKNFHISYIWRKTQSFDWSLYFCFEKFGSGVPVFHRAIATVYSGPGTRLQDHKTVWSLKFGLVQSKMMLQKCKVIFDLVSVNLCLSWFPDPGARLVNTTFIVN